MNDFAFMSYLWITINIQAHVPKTYSPTSWLNLGPGLNRASEPEPDIPVSTPPNSLAGKNKPEKIYAFSPDSR